MPKISSGTLQIVSLKMEDGTNLSVSLFKPLVETPVKFPLLIEMVPYRKDDLFYQQNLASNEGFLQQGWMVAQVDVRGTGSSGGAVPAEEYSEAEIEDLRQVIEQLSKRPDVARPIVLLGISWSAINALVLAAKNPPPELDGLIIAHGTDEHYFDDIHFVDGVFHMDEYHLDMNHEVALPASPDYAIDDKYLSERFQAEPWLAQTLAHQENSEFWKKKSVRYSLEKIKIPIFYVGGWFDSYRDTGLRLWQNLKSPLRLLIGNWSHEWPDETEFGPKLAWHKLALDWILNPQRERRVFEGFERSAIDQGSWCKIAPENFTEQKYYFSREEKLLINKSSLTGESSFVRKEISTPGAGADLGSYWGELNPFLKTESSRAFQFTTVPLKSEQKIFGQPELSLYLKGDPGTWVFTLEDVDPQGVARLITGANRWLPKESRIKIELHAASWTLPRGHRLRVSIQRQAFPMLWPDAKVSRDSASFVQVDDAESFLKLEFLSTCAAAGENLAAPAKNPTDFSWRGVEPAQTLTAWTWPDHVKTRATKKISEWSADGEMKMRKGAWTIHQKEKVLMRVHKQDSARASYLGSNQHSFSSAARTFKLTTKIDLKSTALAYHLKVNRILTWQDLRKSKNENRKEFHFEKSFPRRDDRP